MLWIIPLIATASLVEARPNPYRTVSTYTAFYGKGSQYDNVAGISELESTVVTFLATKFITSTWYIPGPATTNPISTPESGEQPNTTTAATPAGNQQVIYVTVPVTVPVIQTVTTIADEAIETVFETVTSSIPAETHFVVVMLITSIKTRISVTTTQSMMGAAAPLSKLLPGSGPGWKREILETGTKTLAPFTSVPPVPGPAPLTGCISEVCVIPTSNPTEILPSNSPSSNPSAVSSTYPSTEPASSTYTPSTEVSLTPPGISTRSPNTQPENSTLTTTTASIPFPMISPTGYLTTTEKFSTTPPQTAPTAPVALAPQISTVYSTLRPTLTTTTTEAASQTITKFVTTTQTVTSGRVTSWSTSNIIYTMTDYAILGVYVGGNSVLTSIVSAAGNSTS